MQEIASTSAAEPPGLPRLRAVLSSPLVWAWAAIWLVTRFLILGRAHFWNDSVEVFYQDVAQYQLWAEEMAATGALPIGEMWQYPPGAGFLMLVPRLGFGEYGESFVALMLAFDLLALVLLAVLGRRVGNYTGVWAWLLGMTLLAELPVLRFDVVPTVLAVAALVVIHRRPAWFGALAGLGAMVKVWPIVVLFGEWDRRRLLRSAIAALAAIAVVLVASTVVFGDPGGFLREQNGRNLQNESVASLPWHLRNLAFGTPIPQELRFGAWEVASPTADRLAELLKWASVAVLAAAAAWWLARDRAIRGGRLDLANATVARDFVFGIVLLLVVVSRVLSPQFMIWLLGLAAIILTAADSRLRRPAWIVIGAVALSGVTYESTPNIVIRDVALLVAAVDASLTLFRMVARAPAAPPPPEAPAPPPLAARPLAGQK